MDSAHPGARHYDDDDDDDDDDDNDAATEGYWGMLGALVIANIGLMSTASEA